MYGPRGAKGGRAQGARRSEGWARLSITSICGVRLNSFVKTDQATALSFSRWPGQSLLLVEFGSRRRGGSILAVVPVVIDG
jgi:hypothetical protein